MKTPCELIQDLLPLYCDGVCSEDSRRIVEEHLQDCETCSEERKLLEEDMRVGPKQINDAKIAQAAAAAWKKGKAKAFIIGCLIALLGTVLIIGCYFSYRWCVSADADDLDALARQAADYFDYDKLFIEEVEQKGNYLAALCTDENGNWCMCVFDRDSLFPDRWRANGGKSMLDQGKLDSWNYGSPQHEAVLIFCGVDLPDEVCWYTFQNGNITYTCPVEHNLVLDLFVLPSQNDINGYPIPLDANQQKLFSRTGSAAEPASGSD